MNWHALEKEEVISNLNTDPDGLDDKEAGKRIQEYGKNQISRAAKKTPLSILLEQFKDVMIMVLIAAAVVSMFLGETIDAIVIIIIVVLNALIGFFQEYRAEKAMEALKSIAPLEAYVIRNGNINKINAEELVPGDIVKLDSGQLVPADLRILSSSSLKLNESILTGESAPVEKVKESKLPEDTILAERENMAYKGTSVVYGKGRGIVVETGDRTELGKIAQMVQTTVSEKTPLQKRLASFSKRLTFVIIGICILLFAVGLLSGEEPLKMFLTAVSLAVAAVPEALPAIVSITLALGAKEMARQNALIRHLPAVETLGSTTFICTDKTGTLTKNQMEVKDILIYGDNTPERKNLLNLSFILNNDSVIKDNGEEIGDPTEIALLRFAKEIDKNIEEIRSKYPRINEVPFDSTRKMMTTVNKLNQEEVAILSKGSFESILEKCKYVMLNGENEPIEDYRDDLTRISDNYSNNGYRTLAFAYKKTNSQIEDKDVEKELVFLGFAAMIDPPRENVSESIQSCKESGISVAMVTGDHPKTAKNIASSLSIINGGKLMTGKTLSEISMEEFDRIVNDIRVYARVDPAQKLKIVNALKDNKQVVAMTGDGVNDAPALKRADIGISMGITGSDVAKEASKMILLDDNFSTIVKAIKQGRKIFDNIKKFIKYTMGSNSGEIWTLVLAPFLGLPIPLLPVHILWINLVTDGLPGLAISYEPAEEDIMKRPPRPLKESIFAHGMGWHVVWVGLLMGGVTLFSQAFAISNHWRDWQTITFTVLCLSQMGHAFAIRSDTRSLFSQGLFSNVKLLGAVFLTFLLQLMLIYVPFFNKIFKTLPLTFNQLLFALGLSTIVFFAVEIEKLLIRKFDLYKTEKEW